jgi:hypothetical protein
MHSALAQAAVFGVLTIAAPVSAQTDPRQILAAARQAMGGDAALSAVQSFVVTGSAGRNLGPFVADQAVEIACDLPDRFVRRASYNSVFGGPANMRMITTQRDGFAGTAVIRETSTEGDYAPAAPPPSFRPTPTPEQRAAVQRTRLLEQQQAFARLALVLFAASHPSYPLQFSSGGQVTLADGRTADAVDATGPDGIVIRLFVDAASHLPAMLAWQERAVIVAAQPSLSPPLRAGNAGLPPGAVMLDAVPGDPRSVPLVEHAWSISEYRVADGLNWPHRFTERVEGRVLEDMTLGKFKLNPKIPDSTFKTAEPSR